MLSFDFLPAIMTGLTVAVLHAALPTHWLPFVLAARSQRWTYKKTFSILLIAGTGHILTTTLIGAAVVWFGIKLHQNFEKGMVLIAVFSVLAFGIYNIWSHFKGSKHSHCDHAHPHHHDYNKTAKDGWAILSLLSLLTFSPCEAFLPVYVSAWPLGWIGFGVLSLVLALGTLVAMTVFMTIVYYGSAKLKLTWLEENEKLVMGAALILLSLMIYLTEIQIPHQH